MPWRRTFSRSATRRWTRHRCRLRMSALGRTYRVKAFLGQVEFIGLHVLLRISSSGGLISGFRQECVRCWVWPALWRERSSARGCCKSALLLQVDRVPFQVIERDGPQRGFVRCGEQNRRRDACAQRLSPACGA